MTKKPKVTDLLWEMRAEVWPLNKIKPYPYNPRTHPTSQVAFLAELLKTYGPDQPIVVDDNGYILKGHGRLLAATKAELKSFPVIVRGGLSETQKRAMRIQDNQVALLSGWDTEMIRHEIGELKLKGFDVALLGFGETQLVSFETQPGPPGQFQAFDESITVEHECPKCHFRFSGGAVTQAKEKKDGKPRGVKAKAKKKK